MKRIPIVVDTDPGVDDLFCLALACAYDDVLDLKAVCTMGGNNLTDVTTQNALDILELFGKGTVPVARGADSYLTAEFGEPVTQFHGKNGIGGITIPRSLQKKDPLPAWDKLYECAKEAAGELILVTVAPLTNVALALNKYPDLPKFIKKIVMMGGSLTRGNITPYAEANVGHDAEAASIVFDSGIPIDMVGLNVTTICPINTGIFRKYEGKVAPIIQDSLLELIRFRNGEAMHDIIALSTLIDEELMTWTLGSIRTELEDEERKGQTVLTPDDKEKNRAAVSVDVSRYDAVIEGMLQRLITIK